MMNKETNGYTDGDLVKVEGWDGNNVGILTGWQWESRSDPEFANVLYNGVMHSVHVDYMMKVKESAK
tara:strand:+ start:537 stop:737 length:201 start_codon:yes stop_codon:yes gene_type:complete